MKTKEVKSENLVLTEFKAKEILKKGFSVVKDDLLDEKQIKKILLEKNYSVNFPVVLKISSDAIVHKTEAGAVKVVYSKEDFLKTLEDFLKKMPKYKARGILLEEFVKGEEIIIGLKKDATFGHVIGFGLGGIFVETVKDISLRACPIEPEDFDSMLEDLKMKDLILGTRGKKNKIEELKKTVIEVSKLPIKNPRLLELDINPLILNEKECKIVDARIVFER